MKLPRQKTEKFENAKAHARESAEKNRNLLFGSLLIFIFLIFAVLQTTDVDLLVGKTLKLPVVGVDIPLTALYLLSAPLTFFVHLNLLRNIEAHAVKLKAWQKANQDQPLKAADLFPFIFDLAVVDHESSLAGLTRWFSQLVIYWLGALTLLLIFWRFTDYQSLWITSLHAGFLFIDLFVLRITRQKILDILSNSEAEKTDESKILSVWQSVKWYLFLFLGGWTCTRNRIGERLSQITGFVIAFISYMHLFLFFSYIFPLLHRYDFPNRLNNIAHENVLFLGSTLIGITSLFQPILIIDQQENLLALNESLLRLQHGLSSNPKEDFGEWSLEHGVGIDLRNRKLRYAQLRNADLRRAQLRKTDLFRANLERAKLQGADLRDAKLQHAVLWGAELQRANLLQANLQDADLRVAKLQGADLRRAELQGANLRRAELQGAGLGRAKLQGANLRRAELQGAGLGRAKLQGANLRRAELQGAGLGRAKLQGADLRVAKLQGTSLREAKLQGADLRIADLQGADLRNFDFGGVDLNKTMTKDVFTDAPFHLRESDPIYWNDLQRVVDDRILKFSSAGEIKEAYLLSFEMVELSNKAKKGAEKPKSSGELINKNKKVIENSDSVSSDELVNTLKKTVCDMEPEARKYALEGIIRNYGPPESNSDRKPTPKMESAHKYLKKSKAPLSCKKLYFDPWP